MSFTEMDKHHTKPGKVIYSGIFIVLFFCVGLGSVAAFMPFSGAVVAPGTVKISQEKKTVQHLEGGIVDQIFVKEGDKVKKGDILIKLNSSQVKSAVALLRGRMAAKLVEAARLEAQMKFKNSFSIPEDLPGGVAHIEEVISSEKDVFERAKKSLTSRIEIQKTRIMQLQERIEGTRNEIESNKDIILSLEEELKAKIPLMEEKYIDKAQILTLKRQLAERKGQNAKLQQLVAESMESIEEIKLSIVSLENIYREESTVSLGRARDEIFQLGKQLGPQVDADERLDIRAPVSGVVINLAIHSEKGGVVRAGFPILDIVPENADLIVECSLRQDKITQVHMGQITNVQLAAFNRVTTPPVEGVVSYISADSVAQPLPSGAAMHSYIVHVKIDKSALEKHKIWLSPGMPATCFLATEKRTFLQYLMEPILLNLDNSMRETL